MSSSEQEDHQHYGLGDPRAVPSLQSTTDDGNPTSEVQLTKQYGKGFSMLKKMGFKTGTGLGPTGEGITAPIEVSLRRKKEGLTEEELVETTNADIVEKIVSPPVMSMEDIEKLELSRKIDNLTDKKRRIEYDIFALSSSEESIATNSTSHDIDQLLQDLIKSQIFSNQNIIDWSIFSQYVSVLRDKYDCNSLWYELEVETIISAAVANMVRRTSRDDVRAQLFVIREIVLDDTDFAKILEYDVLPKLWFQEDVLNNVDDLKFIKQLTSANHFESLFQRFTWVYLEELLKSNLGDALTILTDWIDVVPEGAIKRMVLDQYVKPILVHSNNPMEVLEWRRNFDSEEWKTEIVVRIAGRILESLGRVDPINQEAFDLVHIAVSWSSVVPPLLIGFLLIESGFLSRWKEYFRTNTTLKNRCKEWILMMGKVCYRSPARQVLEEYVNFLNGSTSHSNLISRRPGAPPRNIFQTLGTTKSVEGLSESAAGKFTFADVVKDECERRNVSLVPRPGMRESGAQVYRLGNRTVYWKEDALYEKRGEWVEISLDSVFR